jgi:ribosomal protein S18 acetylase RimI-like enzyme
MARLRYASPMSESDPTRPVAVRPIEPRDLEEVRAELIANWASPQIWSLGRRHQADELAGFVAEIDGLFAGLVTINPDPGGWQCEVITLSARVQGRGVGALLLSAAEGAAREAGCQRIYLTTTNDNSHAIRFYQRRGWRFAALHKGIVDAVRARKVDLPLTGFDGIQVRDEIEFERWLTAP